MTRTDRVHTNDTYSPSCTSNDVVQNVRLHTQLLTNEEATLQSYCSGIRTLTMRYKVDYPARSIPTMRHKVIIQQNTLQRCITRKRTTRTAERLKTRESSLCSREDLLLPIQASPVSADRRRAGSPCTIGRLKR